MIIKCWGSRGSIPVSGRNVLKYGGDTTCIEVRTEDNEVIIIDAGSGIRNLGNALANEKRHECAILFTHYHWDHTLGLPFFKPVYMDGMQISIYGCSQAENSLEEVIPRLMVSPYFPVDLHNVKSSIVYHRVCNTGFQIKSVLITPISLSHPNQCLGYKLVENNKCAVIFTDNELTFKHPGRLDYNDYLDFAHNADLFIHDAQYTQKEYEMTIGWGHSVYTDALKLALEAGVSRFGLFHHDPERTDAELDKIVEDCNKQAKMGNSTSLDCFAVYEGMEINL
jgi:phosphoribosyl 1,2-cyclic phosphodiesterase